MNALAKIRNAGFSVALVGESFEIIPASALTQTQREFLKSHRAEIVDELRTETSCLSVTNRQKLLDYLAAIDETDPEMIQELLDVCAKDADKLAWALGWADKVLGNHKNPHIRTNIKCGNCLNFEPFYPSGSGPGSCSAGESPLGACHWSETPHECRHHQFSN